ncbi:hypothetical protein [Nocardia acidivorans]|uniref:hypothetical protein n=1 Tax=Nocardia acidivorans TaxID=404580 RepID=UPI0012FB8E9D|nr:hypothetical protein [Nocardia acidivorans]
MQFSYRWTAAPELDLNSDAAIVTRAVIESAFIATITRTTDKQTIGTYTYPGYTRAVDPAIRDEDNSLYSVWDAGNLNSWAPLHGTTYAYLVSLRKPSGDPAARTIDALTCVWFNGLSTSLEPGKYQSLFVSALLPQAVELTLTAPQDETPRLTALGHGTARFPTADVFGQWSVTSMQVKTRWSKKDSGYQDPCATLPSNPVPQEQLNSTDVTFYPNQLPTLDPYPGWPADTEPPTNSTGVGK